MDEQWKPMVGYEDLYLISDQGKAWSIRRNRIMRGTPSKHRQGGYIEFCAVKDGKQKTMQMHREVYRAFKGPIPKGMHVRHKNGNPADNRLENLKIGTAQENVDDRREKGYQGIPLLSKEQLAQMQGMVDKGIPAKTIAANFGVSVSVVYYNIEGCPGLPKREDVYKCIIAGAKVKLVAEYYGTTHMSIVAIMKRHYTPVRQLRKQYSLNKSLTLEDIHRIITE